MIFKLARCFLDQARKFFSDDEQCPIERMKVKELKEDLKKLNLPSTSLKKVLVECLQHALAENEENVGIIGGKGKNKEMNGPIIVEKNDLLFVLPLLITLTLTASLLAVLFTLFLTLGLKIML